MCDTTVLSNLGHTNCRIKYPSIGNLATIISVLHIENNSEFHNEIKNENSNFTFRFRICIDVLRFFQQETILRALENLP